MSAENKSDTKSNKDEKCAVNKKLFSTTIRVTVSLREPDEESCSVFNYISLIAEEKRNRRREKEKISVNGDIEENEQLDDEVKKIAQHFEEKYGGGNTKKKKKKKPPTFYNYTELAAGYDENDSFIDNSEAFDEALPDEMETIHGGYYVNCGQLEFKKVELGEDTSEFEEIRINKKKNCVLKSDDSDSENDSDKSDIGKADSIDGEVETTHKKLPEEINHKGNEIAKSVTEVSKTSASEKIKLEKSKENVPSNGAVQVNGEMIKKRKKYKKRRLEDEEPVDGLSKSKKKAITVKTMLEEKRVVENGDVCVATAASVAAAVLKSASDNVRNSINDVIESVVNAARNEDSRDSTCSSSDTKSIDSRTSYDTEKDSHHEEMEVTEASGGACGFPNVPKEQIKLPDNLPADVLDLVTQIKNAAQKSDLGVRTFFNPYINSRLLSLEIKVRPLMSNVRHALYGHLSNFLPCSKDTLMKRAKKLLIEEEEKHMVEPFKKLKANVDKTMPTLLSNYEMLYQKAVEEKAGDLTKNGDMDEKKSPKLPSKKFIWTEETRNCLRDLVACRLKCFHMLKPRKESMDEYVKKFLETRVKSIWPPGWMETSILWKEFHNTSNTTTKPKKPSLTSQNATTPTTMPTSSTASATTTNTTKKSHSSTVPTSNNSNATVTSMNAASYSNLLTNSLTLQSLAMQYSQSDLGYPITSSSSIPYAHDLNLLTAAGTFSAQNPNIPFSMDILSRIALANNQFTSGLHGFPKVKSPPKKQSPSPGYSSSQRSTTPHSNQSASSFMDAKKIDKMADAKFNDLMKIDSIINANKGSKKEHHMLNHISQYNKHYSHKTEKRKSIAGHERKESFSSTKTSSGTHSNSAPSSTKATPCEVLDLSPNKPLKSDKSETIHQNASDHKNETSVPSATAKDHNYWSTSAKKDDEIKEPKEKPVLPLIQRSIPSETTPVSLSQVATPKPTHISRKQRILQESAKSAAQEVSNTETFKSNSDNSKTLQTVNFKESTYFNESRERHVIPPKEEDRLCSIKEDKKPSGVLEEKQIIEETATATDILSKIINDTLQNNTPLQPQFTNPMFENTKIKQEIKVEDVELQLNEFNMEKPANPSVRESQTPLDKSSTATNSERKTSSNDRAEIEAAEVIKDLLVLNQIGGHNSMRRLDYQDSRYIENRHLNSDLNYSNGSMLSQSSPHSSNNNKTSSIPRMNLTGFQDEFLQHIFKMDRDSSSHGSSSTPDNCFSSDFPSLENNKTSFNHVSSSSVKPGNSSIFNYQSVIMPPSSVKWHTPESKS